ncbi:MAG: type II toxin-antitoxin system VapC family toxin [Deltaproteobacteria bacterium]|nr:type II toxin-antitoxin system VapC family toxin [Deltaproteobacteria bacterium]
MIAVDTNILVRLLVKDDERQTRKVTRFFQRLDADGERAHVSDVVVCELMWVLRSAYDFDRADIARTLRSMIAARQLMFDSADRLLRALSAFQAGRGDLADYVIREHARAAGADAVLTFDKALLKDTMFVAP